MRKRLQPAKPRSTSALRAAQPASRALAQLLNRHRLPLNPANGFERPLTVAVIDESRCIGCTLCIPACPVDAIVGSAKADACGDCLALHRLRPVPAALPDGLHFNGSGGASARVDRRQIAHAARRTVRAQRRERLQRATAPRPRTTTRRSSASSAVAAAIARARAATRTTAAMNPAKRRAIYETLRALNPNPTTELLYSTPFELLVAVVLSAQATDKGVNAATRVLFKIANTPRALAQARRRTARQATSIRPASIAPRRAT